MLILILASNANNNFKKRKVVPPWLTPGGEINDGNNK